MNSQVILNQYDSVYIIAGNMQLAEMSCKTFDMDPRHPKVTLVTSGNHYKVLRGRTLTPNSNAVIIPGYFGTYDMEQVIWSLRLMCRGIPFENFVYRSSNDISTTN